MINEVDSMDKFKEVKSILEDRFGHVSHEMEIYMYEEWFEKLASKFGIKRVKQTKTNIDLPAQMRTVGYLTYTNILDHDAKLRKGDYSPLATFVESETDFIQTDVAEIVHDYLLVEELR